MGAQLHSTHAILRILVGYPQRSTLSVCRWTAKWNNWEPKIMARSPMTTFFWWKNVHVIWLSIVSFRSSSAHRKGWSLRVSNKNTEYGVGKIRWPSMSSERWSERRFVCFMSYSLFTPGMLVCSEEFRVGSNTRFACISTNPYRPGSNRCERGWDTPFFLAPVHNLL